MIQAIGQAHLGSWSLSVSWSTAFWFLLAAFVLDLFDISLRRGDNIGVSGALYAASLWVVGPVQAVAVCLGATALAHVVRWGLTAGYRLAGVATARVVAMAVTYALVASSNLFGPAIGAVMAVMVPATFLMVEMSVAQIEASLVAHHPIGRLLTGNLRIQAPLLLAQWSASVLLILTFSRMGIWSLVPVVALLLLIRQSYALFLEIRETYQTTIEVLVEAAESQDERTLGHAERSASIARSIAMRVGLTASQVETVSYAALLHDVDALAASSRQESSDSKQGKSSAVLEEIGFFSEVLPILRVCDGCCVSEDDYSRDEFMAAMIVALASDADVTDHPGMALIHHGASVGRFSRFVPVDVKAAAVSAALSLGHKTQAVY